MSQPSWIDLPSKCEGITVSPNYCHPNEVQASYTPVPVPGTLPLLIIGIVAIKYFRRKQGG